MNEEQMVEKIVTEATKLAEKISHKLNKKHKVIAMMALAVLAAAGLSDDEEKKKFFEAVEQLYLGETNDH